MRWLLLSTLLVCSTTNAQDGDDPFTVGEIQNAWREGDPDSHQPVQIIFMSLFHGYSVGLAQGIATAALASGATETDMTKELVSCMPEADRLFYMLLAAPPADENLVVVDFITKAVVDGCRDTIDRLLKPQQ